MKEIKYITYFYIYFRFRNPVNNDGSGSNFLTRYGSGSQKATVSQH